MISPSLLSGSLAAQVASEVVCACCQEAVVEKLTMHICNEIKEAVNEERHPNTEFFKVLFKALEPYEKKFKTMVHGIWEEERLIIVANIKKMKKAYLTKDAIDQLLYPKATYEKKLSAQAAEIMLVVLAEQGAAEMESIGALDVVFDVTNPEVQKWLAGYTPKFSAKLEEVSVLKLRSELIEGINAGEGIPELIKRVNLTYDNWDKVRSETIARSETSRAANRANLNAYRQSGIVKKKIWMAEPDACQWCAPLDGKIVDLEKPFFDIGDEYTVRVDGKDQTMQLDYETVETPPLHPRCRCAISAWMED